MARSTIGLFNNLRTRQTVQVGEGTDVQRIENTAILDYQGFKGGLNVSVPPSRLPEGYMSDVRNFDINEKDELIRVPGVVIEETFSGRTPRSMFVHGNPSTGAAEIVFIDGAFLGVRGSAGFATIWYNLSLPANVVEWAACTHGDVLVLTNGAGSAAYYRQPGATAFIVLPWGPARTVMSFAGRVFAGGISDGGIYAPMGVFWTGSTSEVDDIGFGSGFEELLDDTANGDQIVAMRSINFNTAAIITKNALWVARATGDPNRPATFDPVANGFGAISNDAVVRVPGGVAYLSQRDVIVFDGNTPRSISLPINSELYPLDTTKLDQYSMNYVEERNTLQLLLPSGMFEYSFTHNRWLRTTIQARRVVNLGTGFMSMVLGVALGATDVGGWGNDWGLSWGTVSTGSGGGGGGESRGLDTTIYLRGNTIGRESKTATGFFGTNFTPEFETNLQQAQSIDSIVSIKRVMIEFRGAGGTVQLSVPNADGLYEVVRTVQLPAAIKPLTQTFAVRRAGKQAGLRVALVAGSVTFGRLQAEVELRSTDRQGGVR